MLENKPHSNPIYSQQIISLYALVLTQCNRFDAWGRRRNPDDWLYDDTTYSELPFDIGYTGHEHYERFGLINMNGRTYDPVLGRFLSPDKYIQQPTNTQNFNRFTYVLNNPLKYKDPSGEFFLGTVLTFVGDALKTAFIDGGLDPTSSKVRKNAWKDFDPTAPWSPTNKAWKIDLGQFQTDPKKSTLERGFQLFSRFTFELPQTTLGKASSHIRNLTGNVDNVDYYGGATLVNKNNSSKSWGFTLGPYINSQNIVADPKVSEIFRHEYGHVIQSQIMGPLYLPQVALPSLIGSGLDDLGIHDHRKEWYETQANRLSYRYFSNYESEALEILDWDDTKYPRDYNVNWYWTLAHPSLPMLWWLTF